MIHNRSQAYKLKAALLASSLLMSTQSIATTFSGSTPGPIDTSAQADNIIQILAGGDITGTATNAVNLNSLGGTVITNPPTVLNPTGGQIISAATAAEIALNITGNFGEVLIGSQSGVTFDDTAPISSSDGIRISSTGVTIENNGFIESYEGSAIHLTNTASDTTIRNTSLGRIPTDLALNVTSSPLFPTILSEAGGDDFTLVNAGFIRQADPNGLNLDTIQLNAPFASITNNSPGIISQVAGGVNTGNAINLIGASEGTITNHQGAEISVTGSGSAIVFDTGTEVDLVNSGSIQSALGSVLYLKNGSLNISITNELTGIITNSTAGTQAILLVDPGSGPLALTNAGTLSQVSTGGFNLDTVRIQSPFTSITNSGKIIQQSGGADSGNAISILNATSGNLSNEPNGLIQVTGDGNAVLLLSASINGNISNAGTIESHTNNTVEINANMLSTSPNVLNTGTLRATNLTVAGRAVLLLDAGTLTGGVTNTGNILNASGMAGTYAINLSGGNATLRQNGGVVSGNVLLAQRDSTGGNGNVLYLNDGSIIGDVTAANTPGVMQSFHINNGTITGTLSAAGGTSPNFFYLSGASLGAVTLGDGGDTVYLMGTNVAGAITGGSDDDTYNVTGGSYGSLISGGGIDTLNIESTFTSNGTINNILNINVNHPDTIFTINQPIINLDNLTGINGAGITVNAESVFSINANISGNGGIITNNGTIEVIDSPSINIPIGSFTNNSGSTLHVKSDSVLSLEANSLVFNANSTYRVDILNTQAGRITGAPLLATNFQAGSNITPNVTGFVPDNTLYTIIDNTVIGVDNATLIQPNSIIVSFTKITSPNMIQLLSSRRSFASLNETLFTQGLATTLDALATDGQMLFLLDQLDQITSRDALEDAMESLLPPFNYSILDASYQTMNNIFEGIHERLFDLRAMHHFHGETISNHNFSNLGGATAAWIKLLGAKSKQSARKGVAGYKIRSFGAALGSDWGLTDFTTLGAAISYHKANTTDKNINPKNQGLKSWQGSFYGWYDLNKGFFLDTILGIAYNDYDNQRTIHVNQIHTGAKSLFNGFQYGLQGDLGWDLIQDKSSQWYFVPFARVKYLHADLDDYTETGAGELNLRVTNKDAHELLAGLGFRLSTLIQTTAGEWLPEFAMLGSYDFENTGEQTVSSFVGAGPAFITPGVEPGHFLISFDFGLNLILPRDGTGLIKYHLECRDKYIENALYLQYYTPWG